ncbi:pentatricopeptide repeat-containing protein At2g20540-like isoform X2 [Andrographis paniculata]|uniref:pentatricopeptide repeat-containing protein At2g20540-like isoform X2 n=1 Tax=Andrographis paniculata TaxID=175694 RepID=UPI0021E84397|nr:pentatricopeptide repeat-containing protein At2g20540-like isoform X2 [Andrographis paniculata]
MAIIPVRAPASFHMLQNILQTWGTHYSVLNQILAHTLTLGIFNHTFYSKLLKAYVKLNKLFEGQRIFDRISNPDAAAWTSLENLYLNNRMPSEALRVFSKLTWSDSAKPDSHSIVAALSACARSKDIANGRIIHGIAYKYLQTPGFPNVDNALIDMYGKNERIGMAWRVFNAIDFKDVAIWTSLLNACLLNGDLKTACQVFDIMPQRNVFSWTAMIVGYIRMSKSMEALELFVRMQHDLQDAAGEKQRQCNPTAVTVVAMLSGCADIGALNLGSSIHGYINKRCGFVSNVAVNNGLIDMYAKSGHLEAAVRLFDVMRRKDLFSWTSLISGLAINGRGECALQVFDSMVESSRLAPNEVTFLSVLSACSHSGLVIQGEELFERFICRYGIKPRIEHYGCMVDLFIRAGCVEKAVSLIEVMPLEPDAVIWRSVMRGCFEHGNLAMAEAAGKKAIELEPGDDAVYVLLWSIYCSKKRWKDSLRTLQMMREQRIKKTPGCSWIEVNGVVCEFVAQASPPDEKTLLGPKLEAQ